MVTARKFGRKIPMPSVVQIKHQILTTWLADQTAIEAREAAQASGGKPAAPAQPAKS